MALSSGLKAAPAVAAAAPVVEVKPAAVAVAPVKRLNPIKLKQLEDRLAAVEVELPAVEGRISAAEAGLGNYSSAAESQRIAAELDGLRERRTALLAEWEEISVALEEQSTAV